MTTLSSTLELTQDRIDCYGVVNGDREMIHYDEALARSRGFRGTVAHGTMLLAPVVDLALRRYGEQFLSGGTIVARWTAPVCAGEIQYATIDAAGVIKAVNASLTNQPVVLRATSSCDGARQ